jgi:uroporphyrinogen decarboxylase
MDSRERVRAALTCRTPDRIPMALAFWEESLPAIAPRTPAEHFGLDVRFVEYAPPADQDDFIRYLAGLPHDVHVGDLAQLRTYHEWRYRPELGPDGPLSAAQTVAELAAHSFPALADPQRYSGLFDQVATWHAQGWSVAGGPPHLGGELFESGYRLRGFANFNYDLAANKALAHYLLDQLTAMILHSVLNLARAGVDILLLDDDVAMPTGLIVGPATWREFFKPRLAEVIRQARTVQPELIVFFHSDGDYTGIIADLVEIGVNVINPLQPDCMDALAIKHRFGEQLALWGTVGTAALWDHGTPDQIRAEVQHRIETLGPQGLLLSPAYDLDYTPFENITAFVDAVKEFGDTGAPRRLA